VADSEGHGQGVSSCLIRTAFALLAALLTHTSYFRSLISISHRSGRSISIAFLKKPSKKLYPDYYNFIKQPIALDDIKKRIDAGTYDTLQDVKNDFELCFNNAKEYNMQDSPIWLDAKELMVRTFLCL